MKLYDMAKMTAAGYRKSFILAAILVILAAFLGAKTVIDLWPVPAALAPDPKDIRKVQVLDRHGVPLSVTYQNSWNYHDYRPLAEIPRLLQAAVIMAEDRRFFRHGGSDWLGRLNAVRQNIAGWRKVRGASTISEQVVRLVHPRPRTVWSRWLEGIEAWQLERRFAKELILEFYLNQVPYSALRRGVVQAARYYFDRDLDTLNSAEMLALAVLVRAPGRLDIHRGNSQIRKPLELLAMQMKEKGLLSEPEYRGILDDRLTAKKPALEAEAGHFVQYVQGLAIPPRLLQNGRLVTTLDSSLQDSVRKILERRLKELQNRNVRNGAVLVVDHMNGEVLAWVNGNNAGSGQDGRLIDAVLTPRQPGSALKPFLYALALEKGWTAATVIDDSPLAMPVGSGLHDFRNYSRQYYGLLRLRDCLGNSLNIPAVRTVQFAGVKDFLKRLKELGFDSLIKPAEYYGEGLALGNGEVTLFELVRAYTALARQGEVRPLRAVVGEAVPAGRGRTVFTAETCSILASILSDPEARRLEFGSGNLLRFPVQTAVKTGTSTDYRDAWSVGFNHRYTVGVWMGNLDGKPMQGVTGSIGPALALRSVFAELGRSGESKPLFLSPALVRRTICQRTGDMATVGCPPMEEWFSAGRTPRRQCRGHGLSEAEAGATLSHTGKIALSQPTPGLQLAMDPRIPSGREAFPLELPKGIKARKIEWYVDGNLVGITDNGVNRLLWQLSRGKHTASARVWRDSLSEPEVSSPVRFVVK